MPIFNKKLNIFKFKIFFRFLYLTFQYYYIAE